MKKVFVFVFLLFAFNFAFAKSAKIFIVNLYSEPMDIKLGSGDEPVISYSGLEAYEATIMKYTSRFGEHKLYFKESPSDKWNMWKSEDGETMVCPVEKDKSYCILVGKDGDLGYFVLDEGSDNDPKVSFLNASKKTVLKMEVSKDWETEVQAYVEKFKPNDISNFVSIKKGNYSLFWQFPYQVEDDYFFFYPKEDGKTKEVFSFKKGDYYLFVIYTKKDQEFGILYVITPEKE